MKRHIMTVHNVKLSVAQLKKILKEKKIQEKSTLTFKVNNVWMEKVFELTRLKYEFLAPQML